MSRLFLMKLRVFRFTGDSVWMFCHPCPVYLLLIHMLNLLQLLTMILPNIQVSRHCLHCLQSYLLQIPLSDCWSYIWTVTKVQMMNVRTMVSGNASVWFSSSMSPRRQCFMVPWIYLVGLIDTRSYVVLASYIFRLTILSGLTSPFPAPVCFFFFFLFVGFGLQMYHM
jgi:hypothetical protein